MANQSNDIEKYLRGELTPAEMHALEQKALHDPFLAEAIEGAEHAGPENFSADVKLLQHSIHDKIAKRRKRTLSIHGWGLYGSIAAGLLLLSISTYVIFLSLDQQQSNYELALNKDYNTSSAPATDTVFAESPTDQTPASAVPNATENGTGTRRREEIRPLPQRSTAQSGSETVAPPLETVSGEFTPRENEREVEAELSEAPIILRDEDVHTTDDLAKEGKVASTTREASGATATNDVLAKPAKIIRGKVVSSEDGMPLPGINVMIKGTTTGTVTDEHGNYEIALHQPEQTLLFSFIGMTSAEVRTLGKEEINVRLSPDVVSLSEVVVTGYSRSSSPTIETPEYEMAEPEGGRKAFKKYLEQNVVYPKEALQNKVEGRVTVEFTIWPNGQLTDFQVIKGIGSGCDEELIRLIKHGPAWTPSKRNGQPVKETAKVRLKFEHPGD